MNQLSLPQSLVTNSKLVYGADGEEWLLKLPKLVSDLCEYWKVEIIGEFQNLTYSFVAPVRTADGTATVLKIAPHLKSVAREARALKIFEGRGSVQLLSYHETFGALLLEMGRLPKNVGVDEFCSVVKALRNQSQNKSCNISAAQDFPHVSTWGLGFEKFLRASTNEAAEAREAGLKDSVVSKADKIFKDLVASSEQETLLHADLHHANLLQRSNGEWISIDPKGVWGEPCYEVGAFLRNPMPTILENKNLEQFQRDRIDIISSQLGYDPKRVSSWAYAQSVLAAIWSVGDGPEQVKRWLRIAEAIDFRS